MILETELSGKGTLIWRYALSFFIVSECELPVEKGTCKGRYSRFYYDPSSGQCKPFTYSGCRGNINNFYTLAECNQRCVCSRPVTEGPCAKKQFRYFYNQSTGLCQLFIYGGCSGNNNNFPSEGACQSVCGKEDVKRRCLRRPEYGTCSNVTERFYYDSNCDCCQTFQYSGCEGNRNNFETSQQCLAKCSATEKSTEKLPDSRIDRLAETTTQAAPRQARCFLTKDRGACNADIGRYYYDMNENSCKFFLWGGCGGNANNFRSRRFCVQVCVQTSPADTNIL